MRQSVKNLSNFLKPIFKEAGYKKSGLNWTKEFEEVSHKFQIQVSQYSEAVYLNVCLGLNSGDRYYDFRGRLNTFIDQKVVPIESEAIDLENPAQHATIFTEVARVITEDFLPVFQKATNITDIRANKKEISKITYITQDI